ncbi:hypothetical protein HMPREF1531_01263 [Propionibacterium sp. oral taxon 192 str. F0372]|uniref:ABC transporter substrate-binding protein n=1 Tax=Propionibacterium sp. oral taxon 192 TaxID=671222 RepID=UPI0003541119|nr:ABC transporter substrate-binding protein [Propionibacterium sp. oral taxon 192]EPH03206.1 hypothetical protein HMPREF1531_01263 [Propionibacterium sp. oral taxon 192 str. F0372]
MNKLRILAVLVATGTLALTACGGSGSGSSASGNKGKYSIGITQIVSHSSLDASVTGFKAALDEAGIKADYDEQNAQGDQATASSIASKFASSDLDLVFAVATPAAQAAAQAISTTPILFTAVTDPTAAGLVDSMENPGGNISGTTDMNPVAEQIALVKELSPSAKKIGVLYSSGEVNSEVQVKLAEQAATAEGLEVVTKTVTATSEVLQAAQTLENVDAIYVPTDNTVVSALDSVIRVAESNHIPLVAGETDSVTKGALITYGLDYEELGRQTGRMAVDILRNGADPATMAVQTQQDPKLVINLTTAKALGIEVPQDLLNQADEIIE